jgi:ribonuclease T2
MSGNGHEYSVNLDKGKVQMRHRFAAILMALLAWPLAARAEGERAGDFDYYVMSLSWSANWCAAVGDGRGDPQCDAGRGLTWVLHGLWPQYEQGYPSYCRTPEGDPARSETAAMADIMGGAGLAFYQWKKHGRCAGLPARDYFQTARAAFGSITLPDRFETLSRDVTLPALDVERAFLQANPQLRRDQITITCKDGAIQEARICLDKSLTPRRCGDDVIRDCTLRAAEMERVR